MGGTETGAAARGVFGVATKATTSWIARLGCVTNGSPAGKGSREARHNMQESVKKSALKTEEHV